MYFSFSSFHPQSLRIGWRYIVRVTTGWAKFWSVTNVVLSVKYTSFDKVNIFPNFSDHEWVLNPMNIFSQVYVFIPIKGHSN